MAKNSVLGHPNNVPNLAREGFNVSRLFTFTASTGMLLPAWYDLVNPGETLKGSPSFLLRTDNFLAPAMADVDIFCDVFYVPFKKILSSFGDWLMQIDDINTDFVDVSKFSQYLPTVYSQTSSDNPFAGFTKQEFDYILEPDSRSPRSDQWFDSFGFGLHRLMFHLGLNPQALFYNCWYDAGGDDSMVTTNAILDDYIGWFTSVACPNFSPYLFCAYQGIYYDYYRNSEFESNNVKAYNMDSIFNDGAQVLDLDGVWQSSNEDRKGMFNLRYRWRSKDYFTATRQSPLINSVSMLPNYAQYLSKVNQWLTEGNYNFMTRIYGTSEASAPFTQVGVELGGIFNVEGQADADLASLESGNAVWLDEVTKTFDVTGGETHNAGLNALYSWLSTGGVHRGTGSSSLNATEARFENPHSHNLGPNSAPVDVDGLGVQVEANLTTARIRTMFALEKLAKITQRAGKHYDDQVLAHFGVKLPKFYANEVYKIKSYHTTLGVQKVTSTSDTQGAALGEQAAVGYAVLDGTKNEFDFRAPDYGIVMCIWSCAPRYKYFEHFDKLALKTTLWDFYKPALDNLGSQPLFQYEDVWSTSLDNANQFSTAVDGWQWRFMESKIKADKVAPVFATNSKNPWTLTSLPQTFQYEGFVSPRDMNKLFNTQYNVAPYWPAAGSQQDYQTDYIDFAKNYLRDPFVIDFYMKCTKVSTMSTFGDMPLNGI